MLVTLISYSIAILGLLFLFIIKRFYGYHFLMIILLSLYLPGSINPLICEEDLIAYNFYHIRM